MSNVSKIFVRLNPYDTAIVNPAIKPAQGELAAMRLTDGRFVLNRVTGNMQGVGVLGSVIQIQRDYRNGEPPYTMADARNERQYSFADYQHITEYFFERLNRTCWDGRRRRTVQEGVQC